MNDNQRKAKPEDEKVWEFVLWEEFGGAGWKIRISAIDAEYYEVCIHKDNERTEIRLTYCEFEDMLRTMADARKVLAGPLLPFPKLKELKELAKNSKPPSARQVQAHIQDQTAYMIPWN